MATGIHAFGEVKIAGKWHLHSKFEIGQSYSLFNKIAGINTEHYSEDILVPLKGMPEDVSLVPLRYFQNLHEDAHSATWFSQSEIKELIDWMKRKGRYTCSDIDQTFGYVFGQYWSNALSHKEYIPKDLEDVRFVFWFDN